MSRFDRRLKPREFNIKRQTNRRSSSPRPGEATCKLRPTNKNTGMLGSTVFMGDTTNPDRPSIEIIENAPTTSLKNTDSHNTQQQITMDNVSFKNNRLIEKLKTIRDPNLRTIYNHEIRLNTIEATIDCLDDIKCGEVLDEQKSKENLHILKNLNNKVDENCEVIQHYSEKFSKVTKNIETVKKTTDEYSNIFNMKIERIQQSLEQKLEEKMIYMEDIKNNNKTLKERLERYKQLLKNILLDNTDENKESLLEELENL